MSRLVLVSKGAESSNGASGDRLLATALRSVLRKTGGVWFGWGGLAEEEEPKPSISRSGDMISITTPLDVRRGGRDFLNYCNSVARPLFHYRLDKIAYNPAYFRGYCRTNARLANVLSSALQRRDIIWIHGCELIPLAHFLRSHGCRHRIGFSLHVPFPPPELMAASPNHRALVKAMLNCDLLGFQTRNDAASFRRYVRKFTSATPVGETAIQAGTRRVSICTLPAGIDVETTRKNAHKAAADIQIEALLRGVLDRRQIVSIDNVDHVAGLAQRFEAYARLLAKHPELHGRVTFLQIASPEGATAGNAAELMAELNRLSGMISGNFGTLDWVPIRYMNRQLPEEKIAAVLRSSQVGLVTPLCEGTSLLAKEYVAAQDASDPGVLVLSRFSGAAEELKEAVLVNPYDVEDMAGRLLEAVTMPLEERLERHKALYARISRRDVHHWRRRFLHILTRGTDDEPERKTKTARKPSGMKQVLADKRSMWAAWQSDGLN